MRFIVIPAVVLAVLSLVSDAGAEAADGAQRGNPVRTASQTQGCGCADRADLAARLRAVQATIRLLDNSATAQAGREPFDANTFDSGLGEGILTAQMTAGGIGAALPVADFDRYSCEITTVPLLGGSACTLQSLNAQFTVRQQACQRSQTSAGQGNDYWEGRMMSEVVRELRSAYAAEEAFINQQLAGLTGAACQNPGSAQSAPAPPVNCGNCLQYIMEGTQTFPIIGRIRMFSNSVIPFTVGAGGRITGSGTILTQLDTAGTICTVDGFNGTADILVRGQINGSVLDAVIAPRGASQTTSAQMTITCRLEGKPTSRVYPQEQHYLKSQRLRMPGPGVPFTEETIDLGAQSGGAMQGTIVLRLYMTGAGTPP